MLLGVSRQSVTKWEAERSYPEMDKLLRLCQIFDCTLDELVSGDLTTREPDPHPISLPSGPAADTCGYDEHMRRFALRISTGVALCVLGLAACIAIGETGTIAGVRTEALAACALFACILAGVALLIPAGMEHSSFVKAHPFVQDFYTAEQKSAAQRQLAAGLVAGIALIFVGIMVNALAEDTPFEETYGPALLFVLVAAAVWLFIYFGMMLGRTNLAEYNRNAAETLDPEDIAHANLTEEERASLLSQRRTSKKVDAAHGVIMLVATIIALVWLFSLPAATGGDWGSIDWNSGIATMFWIPWMVGGLLCGIVSVIAKAFEKEE